MSAYDQKLLQAWQDSATHLKSIAETLEEIRVEIKRKRLDDAQWQSTQVELVKLRLHFP